MDADRFDTFTRSLTTTRSRRRALATLLGGTLGLLGLAETAARKKGNGRNKRKRGGTPSSPPPPPTDSTAPPPTEPTAPPSPPCIVNTVCGSDANGQCYCRQPTAGGPTVCFKAEEQNNVGKCADCAADTSCVATPQPGDFYCFKSCGAV